MKFQFNIFLAALGLAVILESLPYFLAPEGVKKVLEKIRDVNPPLLRYMGIFGITLGLALIAVSRLVG